MSDEDERIRVAYAFVHVPDEVKARTRERIESERASGACGPGVSDEEAFAPLYGCRAWRGDAAYGPSAKRDGADAGRGMRDCAHAPDAEGPREAGRSGARCGSRRRRPRSRIRPVRRIALAAAACLTAAAVGAGGYAYATPAAYVGVDADASFELSVNRFDRVVEARAADEEAASILAGIDVSGMSSEEALNALAQACGGEGATVEVGVACDDETRCASLESAAARCFGQNAAQVHCGRVDDEQREAARAAGMGMGRYRIYEALVEGGVSLSIDEASSLSAAELRALAEESGIDTGDSVCAGRGHEGASSCGKGRGAGVRGVGREGR